MRATRQHLKRVCVEAVCQFVRGTEMTHDMSLKRVLLQTVVGTLVLAALVGIYVFLFGDFGETEAKILGTTLTISAFSLTSLACAAAHEQRRYSAALDPRPWGGGRRAAALRPGHLG